LGTSDIKEEIDSKHVKITKGEKEDIVSIFSIFDKFDPTENYKVPPLKE